MESFLYIGTVKLVDGYRYNHLFFPLPSQSKKTILHLVVALHKSWSCPQLLLQTLLVRVDICVLSLVRRFGQKRLLND